MVQLEPVAAVAVALPGRRRARVVLKLHYQLN
jgi:hypothetical protein